MWCVKPWLVDARLTPLAVLLIYACPNFLCGPSFCNEPIMQGQTIFPFLIDMCDVTDGCKSACECVFSIIPPSTDVDSCDLLCVWLDVSSEAVSVS